MQTQPSHPFATLSPAQLKLALEKAAQKVEELRSTAIFELELIETELARRKCATLRGFIETFWDIVEPKHELKWNWHLDEICTELDRLERGENLRLIINVPFGTMKSLLTIFFRAKLWAKDPTLRLLGASYSEHLSLDFNEKLRSIVQSDLYRKLFPLVQLTGDKNAKQLFGTTSRGWSFATSVGGAGTGEHPDWIFIDDPLTALQARSEAERNTAIKWIDGTMMSRGITRGVKIVLIMQRLHPLDPSGHLIAKGGWVHINFPMRYIGEIHDKKGLLVDQPDPRDRRMERGQLLWPELFPEELVRKSELDLGPWDASAQLQQRPVPEGGGLFKRENWKFVEALPLNIRRRVRGWDTAGSEDSGDWTVGTHLLEDESENIYIEHVVRERLSPDGVDKLMTVMAQRDGHETVIREEKEPGGSGKAVIAAHTKLLKGYDYNFVQLGNDKVTRAKPIRSQQEAGNVYILVTGNKAQDAWIEPFLAELSVFPVGENEDQVDSLSCAYNSLVLEPLVDNSVTW